MLGSGAILREMIKAAEILQNEYHIDSNLWSVTSYNELRKEAIEVERYNLLNPDKRPKKHILKNVCRLQKVLSLLHQIICA